MNRFRYLRDSLFVVAAGSYALNRCLLQSLSSSRFLHGHFDDLLLIPAALPVVLWLQRKLGLRADDRMPCWSEMWLHLGVWSLVCELIGPLWLHHGTADPLDVMAYAAGGVTACLWWNYPARATSARPR